MAKFDTNVSSCVSFRMDVLWYEISPFPPVAWQHEMFQESTLYVLMSMSLHVLTLILYWMHCKHRQVVEYFFGNYPKNFDMDSKDCL